MALLLVVEVGEVRAGAADEADLLAARNAGAVGDNRNALLRANVVNQGVLNGGTTSLSSAVQSYVGTVGIQTSQAQNGATAQQSVLNSAQSAQQSVSGVNPTVSASCDFDMPNVPATWSAASSPVASSKAAARGASSLKPVNAGAAVVR